MQFNKISLNLLFALGVCLTSAIPTVGSSQVRIATKFQNPIQSPETIKLVRTKVEYERAARSAKAGDTIVLANGIWNDFEITISAQGEMGRPVKLRAQEVGKVILSGRSNLRIGGQFIEVSGLVFKNGYTPTGEVIAFRRSKEDQARNSRVSEIVIDNFNQVDRTKQDIWVAIDGQGNRFDHSYLVGKTNEGVTLAVRLDLEGSRENNHRIDHNYFGPRPVLGSNGGETIRVGTSTYSMFDSKTIIENNVFDRCDGEVEIVSIKSGANVIRGNLFKSSSGAVVLRHGDGNIVERNVFLGENKPNTGGVRVINRNQIVRNNYMEGLRGTGFASALTVMNGIPNSPINRYVQVINAQIHNNSIVNSWRISLGAGADSERSAAPIDSRVNNNIVILEDRVEPINLEDKIDGIIFANNLVVASSSEASKIGETRNHLPLVRASNGLFYPRDSALQSIGAPRDLSPIMLNQVGPAWYSKPHAEIAFGQGREIRVGNNEGDLERAVNLARNGDRLLLASGTYQISKTILINKKLSITGNSGGAKPVLRPNRSNLFEIAEGGGLRLSEIEILGTDAPDAAGNSIIRTIASPAPASFTVEIDNISVKDLNTNRSFDFLMIGKGALAKNVSIDNSRFENISGKIISAEAETENLGRYNADNVAIAQSTFSNVQGELISLYRGGTDESTFGPVFQFINNRTLNKGGTSSQISLNLHGIPHVTIKESVFENTGPIRIMNTTGEPSILIERNRFLKTLPPIVAEERFKGQARANLMGNLFDGVPQ